MVTLKLEPFDPEVGIAIDAAWISFMSTWDIKYNFENFYKLQIIQSFCFAIQLSGKNSVRNETDPVPLEDRDHAEDACGHLLAVQGGGHHLPGQASIVNDDKTISK